MLVVKDCAGDLLLRLVIQIVLRGLDHPFHLAGVLQEVPHGLHEPLVGQLLPRVEVGGVDLHPPGLEGAHVVQHLPAELGAGLWKSCLHASLDAPVEGGVLHVAPAGGRRLLIEELRGWVFLWLFAHS